MNRTVIAPLKGVTATHKGMSFVTEIPDIYGDPIITITDETGLEHPAIPLRFFGAPQFGLQDLVRDTERVLFGARRDLYHPKNIAGCVLRSKEDGDTVINANDVAVFDSLYYDNFPYLKWEPWGLITDGIKGKWTLKLQGIEEDIASVAWFDEEGIALLAELLLDREAVKVMAALLHPEQAQIAVTKAKEREAHLFILSLKVQHRFPAMRVSQMAKLFQAEGMASLDPSETRDRGVLTSVGVTTTERYNDYSTSRKIHLALAIRSPHTPRFSERLSDAKRTAMLRKDWVEQERIFAVQARVVWEDRFRHMIEVSPDWRLVDLSSGRPSDAHTFWITKLKPEDWVMVESTAKTLASKIDFGGSAVTPF